MEVANEIRNEREDTTTETIELQKIRSDYFEYLYIGQPRRPDKFLDIYNSTSES
jgi:hypothetical protein